MRSSCSYSVLVEQRAPTLRATLMISLYLLARLLYRDHSALNTIGLAALILLLSRPAWLFESGFQLSFSAALLIVGLVAPILERTTEPYRRALRNLDETTLDARLAPKQAQFRLDLRALITGLRKRFRFLDQHGALASAAVTGPTRLIALDGQHPALLHSPPGRPVAAHGNDFSPCGLCGNRP